MELRFVALALSIVSVGAVLAGPVHASGGFEDIPEGIWYEDAVAWMVDQGITAGTSATTFSPDEPVTRAQAVTLLYRLSDYAGSKPPPAAFTDVSEEDWFGPAVGWATRWPQTITLGTSDTTFSPHSPVTRGQFVTFLSRYADEWFLYGTAAYPESPFIDVAVDDYFYEPTLRMTAFQIVNGTSPTTFSPDDPVTRAQAAALIWRLAGEPEVGNPGAYRTQLPYEPCSGIADAYEYACLGALALYVSTAGPLWDPAAVPWMSDMNSMCSWSGITCDNAEIISISLPSAGLRGVIPPEVVRMTGLHELDIGDNSLVGSIPSDITLYGTRELWTVDFSANALAGVVPDEFRTHSGATTLDLSGQAGCLTASPTTASWLDALNATWDDGCP